MSETRRVLIDKVFPALRKRGFVARANFACCGTCGHHDLSTRIEDTDKAGYVFWHMQDEERLRDLRDRLGRRRLDRKDGIYLKFNSNWKRPQASPVEVGQAVALEARLAGLKVDWNGSADQCVWVEVSS